MVVNAHDILTIGQLSQRTGIPVSAIRFYEERGLVSPFRSNGGQRRFLRSDIRRLSFIRIAQQLDLSIEAIAAELGKLPHGRTPNAADWKEIAASFQLRVDERIAALTRMRDRLTGCIGCGCLSLERCHLYNPGDRASATGTGPRFLSD